MRNLQDIAFYNTKIDWIGQTIDLIAGTPNDHENSEMMIGAVPRREEAVCMWLMRDMGPLSFAQSQ